MNPGLNSLTTTSLPKCAEIVIRNQRRVVSSNTELVRALAMFASVYNKDMNSHEMRADLHVQNVAAEN